MIDKVELRVPHFVSYSREFGKLYQELRNDPKGPFKESAHYLAVADLREHGYPVVLHTHNKHDKRGNFKIELLETGGMGYKDMRTAVSRVFVAPVGTLELMRLDLAADVEGVPVSWFQRNIRVEFKRWRADIGTVDSRIPITEMGRRGVETVYFGKRPNVVRIYNKVAERLYRYARMVASAKREGKPVDELPTFEAMFGHPAEGFTLTRVERQMAGGRVPEEFQTFDKLRGLPDFNPFASLIYSGVGKPEPHPDNYDLTEWLAGMKIREMVERDGIHRFRQFANRHSKRNGSRLLKQYPDFLPADGCFISNVELYDRYRGSVLRQFAA